MVGEIDGRETYPDKGIRVIASLDYKGKEKPVLTTCNIVQHIQSYFQYAFQRRLGRKSKHVIEGKL